MRTLSNKKKATFSINGYQRKPTLDITSYIVSSLHVLGQNIWTRSAKEEFQDNLFSFYPFIKGPKYLETGP